MSRPMIEEKEVSDMRGEPPQEGRGSKAASVAVWTA